MRTLTDSKAAAAVVAGLTLVGALSGCASTASAGTAGVPSDNYTDGTYTQSGSYQSPGGEESVAVTVTLARGIITDLKIVGTTTDSQAKAYQAEFISGIDAIVVGKNIDQISVDKVGGSSLTSGGFNDAIDLIKADAGA